MKLPYAGAWLVHRKEAHHGSRTCRVANYEIAHRITERQA